MKRYTLLTALLTLSISLLTAQPILNQSDIGFQIGDIQVIDSLDYMDISSQVGPNMTWDLSALSTQGTLISAEVVPPTATSSGSSFPNSTIARTFTYLDFTFDQFFNFDAASMQHLGSSFSFGSSEYVSNYTDPEIALPIPMIYGDSGTDIYASEQSGAPGAVTTSGEINWEVPGYGTLMVNGQTYNDVLLYKFNRLDTTFAIFGGITFHTYSNEVTHMFMAAGYHYPIVIFTEDIETDAFSAPDTTFHGSVLVSQTTGLADAPDILPDLKVFPNPVDRGVLTVEYTLADPMDLIMELVDLSGRVILIRPSTESVGRVSQQIQLPEELEAGMYLLHFRSADGIRSVPVMIE